MKNIYGITFKDGGKMYYFTNATGEDIKKDDCVIVLTEKGMQYGKVVNTISKEDIKIDSSDLKEIIRLATDEDYEHYLSNLKDATSALTNAKKLVEELNLDMLILNASFTFDKKQLLFNFTADERIDFRELAKRLAGIYRTRIELRQIGARDKAKEIGGIGQCGRCLCCNSFLGRIDSISMNMAKNQNIALNPNKINGQCGRLLCCLTYENDEYTICGEGMPYVGQSIKTPSGMGKVMNVDILNRKYTADVDGNKVEVELETIN